MRLITRLLYHRCAVAIVATILISLAVIAPAPVHAAESTGGCSVIEPTCTVGAGGGGGTGSAGTGSIVQTGCQNTDPSNDGCNPCPADAGYGAQPPAVSQVCAAYLRNGFCAAILADALGGLKVPTVQALSPEQIATLNAQFKTTGCPAVVTPASLAQQAFATIRFPRPSGLRSPSPTLLYEGLPFTYVNFFTFFWTNPAVWRPLTAVASAQGLTASVTATPVQLVFDPGDGGPAVACAGPGRAWVPADGNGPPTDGACAYRYSAVTARPIITTQTIVWNIRWTGTGNTGGEIPALSTSTSGQLQVLQIQVVNR